MKDMSWKAFFLAIIDNKMVWLTIVAGVVIWLVQIEVIDMRVMREVLDTIGEFFKSLWPG